MVFLFGSLGSYASHIFGGELLYKHLSGNRYAISLTLYGDCSGSIFNTLDSPLTRPKLFIYNSTALFASRIMKQDLANKGIDVSPVCPDQLNNTTCRGGQLPGVKKYVYLDTIDLSGPSSNWRFIFSGDLVLNSAGRSNSITNIYTGTTGTVIQLEARLNNTAGPNSSPKYTTVPTPYYCISMESSYNQGAVDSDGDSLAFRLVSGVAGSPGTPLSASLVNYIPPATASIPILTEPGAFVFNQLNGQLTFTANAVQHALVVYQVLEYKGGVLVGTSLREMTFIVTDDCQAAPPALSIQNVTGGSAVKGNLINVCIGTPHLSFNIVVNSTEGDVSHVTANTVPATANLTISNNHTTAPVVNFSWDTDTLPTGIYTFYLVVKDDHCPISTTQTLAYSINVVNQPTIAAMQISPTQCVYHAAVKFDLAGGYLPRMLTITQGTQVIHGYADSTGLIIDSLYAGTYTATVGSDPTCRMIINFTVADSGKLPLGPITADFCKGDAADSIFVQPAGPGATFTWFDSTHNIIDGPPFITTDVPATYKWFVQEKYKVCISDTVSVTANVHELPDATITSRPSTICYGDSIYLSATGGVQYSWMPEDIIKTDRFGRVYTRITDPVEVRVKVVDQYGCFNTDSISYLDIQPCCNFSYPNAFTPNGDGLNDGFKVVTYGNMWDYRMAIYNRWGQVVFLTVDPGQYWDGKQYGVPCEAGTYFFYFTGRCLTGRKEEHKGDITLIR